MTRTAMKLLSLATMACVLATAVPQLRVAKLAQHGTPLDELLALAATSTQADDAAVRAALQRAVPEYRSSAWETNT